MLQEAINTITTLAQQAAGAKGKLEIVKLPGEPDHIYGVVNDNGELTIKRAEPHPRRHTLRSVEEIDPFLAWAKTIGYTPVVWIADERIVVVLDEDASEDDALPRRETATLTLEKTPQFLAVERLEKTEDRLYSKDMYRLIRRVLWEAFDPEYAEKLAKLFRSMAWQKQASGNDDRSLGRANYSQTVVAQVTMGGDPVNLEAYHDVPLRVRIYTDPMLNTKFPVKAYLDDDADEKTFAIVPLPGQLAEAKEKQLTKITELVRGLCDAQQIPCFYGTP